jgi:hypothetical protein
MTCKFHSWNIYETDYKAALIIHLFFHVYLAHWIRILQLFCPPDRSINCHMALSAMNYLINIENSSHEHTTYIKSSVSIYLLWTFAEVHILFCGWQTGPYIAIWPEVPWTICYIIFNTWQSVRRHAFVISVHLF